jgi:hypothetical protein
MLRVINLAPYTIEKQRIDDAGNVIKETEPFNVRQGIGVVLYGMAGLKPLELLTRDALAQKIDKHPADEIALDDAEYALLNTCVLAFDKFGRHDVELVKRILSAPPVAVEPKPPTPGEKDRGSGDAAATVN